MNYFTVQEVDNFTFFRIPKALFTDERYKNYSAESKVLYGILLDRTQLSKENEWIDEEGRVYIYFKRENAEEMLGIKRDKAIKLFKELKNADLIDEIQQGLNKPNIIYVKKFIEEKVPRAQSNQWKSEKPTSRGRKNRLQEVGKTDSINTDYNNTELNKTESQSVSPDKDKANYKNKNSKTEKQKTDRLTDKPSQIIEEVKKIYGEDIVNQVLKEKMDKCKATGGSPYRNFLTKCCEELKDLKNISVNKTHIPKFTHEHSKSDLDEAIRRKTQMSYELTNEDATESHLNDL